jgi:hypothetical protein
MRPALLGALTLLASCQTSGVAARAGWRGEIERWGTMREALRDGQDQARVAVATVARPGVYALGALEGLRGEITVLDGEVWVSEGQLEHPLTTRGRATDAQATLLFAAEVQAWRAIPIAAAVDPSEFDAFVAEQARAAGLDTARPFPFLVEGGLVQLDLHVIAGECPMRARMLGTEAESPAFELRVDRIEGRLLGLYAQESSGVLCHMGARTHVHAVLAGDGDLTGHVDTVGLAAGAVLKLPIE